MIAIYHYHPVTKVFIAATYYKQPEGVGLPAHSTAVPPPDFGANEAAMFDGESWQIVEDHLGVTVYSKSDGAPMIIETYGPLPSEYTVIAPTVNSTWDETAGEWGVDRSKEILFEISNLEAQQTPRRIREAALSTEGYNWLENLDSQIVALRNELSTLNG